jgi:hypothetical protein
MKTINSKELEKKLETRPSPQLTFDLVPGNS